MKKLKVGIIGAGRIGQVHAKSITYHIPQAEILAISDIYEDGAAKVANELGIPAYYKDYHKILENPDIDAVLICSGTDTHADIACEAAAAGKHIFCEKPVDLTVAKIKKVIEAVDKAGVKLQIGFNRRYDHNFAQIKKLEQDGKIGKLQTIKITSRDPEPPAIEYVKVSGGIFLDMTVHDFDMARFIGGEVEEVYANATVMVDPAIGEAGAVETVRSALLTTAARRLTAMISALRFSARKGRQRQATTPPPMFCLLMKTAMFPINRSISSLKDICSPSPMK